MTILADVTEVTASEVLRRGVNCIVNRNAEPQTIVRAVLASLSGETVLPTDVVRRMIEVPAGGPPNLDGRDTALLECLAQGMTTETIAAQMACSVRTLNRWKQSLYRRIGARNQAEALALAMVWGVAGNPGGGACRHSTAKVGIELTVVDRDPS